MDGCVECQAGHQVGQSVDIGLGYQQLWRCHAQDQLDAVSGISQVDRQAHRAHGADRNDRGDLLERSGQGHTDHIPLSHTLLDQARGQRLH